MKMRKPLTIALVLIAPLLLTAQKSTRYNPWRAVLSGSLAGLSGAAWGMHETVSHHYGRFEKRFPNANPQYFNPALSWENKYHSRIPFARTLGVVGTDFKHLTATVHRVTLFGAGISIAIGEKRPAWHYVANVAASGLGFVAGFHGVYTLFFKA